MIRQFKLINSRGDTYELNDTNSFLNNFKGLGQEHKATYIQTGNRFINTKNELTQKKISGKIRFRDYEGYNKFSLFIQHKPLTLEYTSYGTYYLDVNIEKLEKTELKAGGLHCNISMVSLGTYYKKVRKELLGDTEGGKNYPYSYPYTYNESASGLVNIQSDSVLDSPCKIHIFGPCLNPSYTHYLNDNVIATGRINCNIESNKKLVIDNSSIPFSIGIYTKDNILVEDAYAKSDFSTVRFLNLQYGKNTIELRHDTSEVIHAVIEGRIEYESI